MTNNGTKTEVATAQAGGKKNNKINLASSHNTKLETLRAVCLLRRATPTVILRDIALGEIKIRGMVGFAKKLLRRIARNDYTLDALNKIVWGAA